MYCRFTTKLCRNDIKITKYMANQGHTRCMRNFHTKHFSNKENSTLLLVTVDQLTSFRLATSEHTQNYSCNTRSYYTNDTRSVLSQY